MSARNPISQTARTPLESQLIASQSAIGLPLGKFSVDSSGEATYRLEIEVPPGIAGSQPKLELVYSHRQRNGVLGIGWGISVGSAIVRSRATYAVDGFSGAVSYDSNDRFSLDGQRLINVDGEYGKAGTLYYTELQSWKHIRAGASPTAGFIVTTRNGEIWEYGTSPDSCIMAAESQQVRLWALTATTDRNGNRIQYSYTQSPVENGPGAETGAYYLDQIAYTVRDQTKANRFVRFSYEERPDSITDYSGGFPIVTAFRLKGIVASVGDEVVRSYAMSYRISSATQLSCLESITQSGTSSEGAPALPPTRMVWQDVDSPDFSTGPSSSLEQHVNALGIQPMDVSGSGRTDLVQLWLDTDDSVHATTYLATPGSNGVSFNRASDSVLGSFPTPREIMAADLDGDGRTDLIIAYKSGADDSLHLAAFLSNGTGFDAAGIFKTGNAWSSKHLQFFAIDANGDGRTDLVEAYAHSDPDRGDLLYFRTLFSQFGDGSGAGFSDAVISPTEDAANPASSLAFWPMDVNGDGIIDLVRVWQRGSDSHVVVTTYIGISTAIDQVSFAAQAESDLGTFSLQNQMAFLPVDVNGDGIQDLLQVWQEPTSTGTRLHLTTFLCDAAGGFVPGPDSTFDNQPMNVSALHSMGFTGGGLVALVSRWISGSNELMFTAFVASPSGVFRVLPSFSGGSVGSSDIASYLAGDTTGGGKAGLIRIAQDSDQQPFVIPYIPTGPYPDLVTSITNSLGGVTTIQYAPLSDLTVYTAQTDEETQFPNTTALRFPNALTPTQFPAQSVLGQALYVVSTYAFSNDPDLNRFTYSSQYELSYSGARIDLLGRGWQGFHQIKQLNRKNGRTTTQTFNQDFPSTGKVASTVVAADGRYAGDPRVPKDQSNVILRIASAEYNAFTRATGFDGLKKQIFEVLPVTSRVEHYDYGQDQFDYAIGRAFVYDEFGNQVVDAYLGYIDRATGAALYPNEVLYRHASFQNDVLADGWALGFPRYLKTTANENDADITAFLSGDYRLEQRTYAPSTYNLASHEHWDNAHGKYLVKSYAYDAYGNRISKTKPGGFVTQYEYESNYNTFLMQTTSPANAAGAPLISLHGFDPRFGVEVARRSPNGFVSIIALDAFGRKIAHQGPLPTNEIVADVTALTPLVTGNPDLQQSFLTAAVVTLENTSYLDDGQGGLYQEDQLLQSFPLSSARDFNWSRSYKDGVGRERQMVHQSGQSAGDTVVLTHYNGDEKASKPARKSLPFFSQDSVVTRAPHYVSTTYDVLHRHIKHQTPSGLDGKDSTIRTWEYGKAGDVTVISGAGSDAAYTQVLSHHFYDRKSRVQQVVVSSDGNATTKFQYDPLGRLIRATDPVTPTNPDGLDNVITYDSLDRRLTVDNPDQNTTGNTSIKAFTYGYDPGTGKLVQQTDAAGLNLTTTYDGLGRKIGQALPDGRTAVLTYDNQSVNGMGHLTRVAMLQADQSVESQYDFAYDSYGSVIVTSLSIAGEDAPFDTYSTHDPLQRVIGQKMPDGSLFSCEYAFGNVVTQSLDGARVDYPLEQYHPIGEPGAMICGSGSLPGQGIVLNFTLNPAGQPYEELVVTGNVGEVLHYSYQYDAVNQLTQISSLDAALTEEPHTYAYDNQRLSTAAVPGFPPGAYEQDESDNIVSKDGISYTSKGHFVVSGVTNGVEVYSAEADTCGRTRTRTANGTTANFDYDGLGCLRRVTSASGDLVRQMLSDYRGRRLRQTDACGTTTTYVSPTYEVTRSTAGEVSITKYLADRRGPVAAIMSGSESQIVYFRRDHKGSMTHTFDSTGNVVSRIAYSGYGESQVVGGSGDLCARYEQRLWDSEIGLYYFGARYYDPVIGRFLTPDSRLGAHDYLRAGALNRYAFELNNPINLIDPTGHSADWIGGLVAGLVIVGVGIAIVASAGAAAPAAAVAAEVSAEAAAADAAAVGGDAAAAAGAAGGGEVAAGQGGAWMPTLLKAASAAGNGLIAGGLSGSGYSIAHQDDFNWKDYGIQSAISAGVGGISAGISTAVNVARYSTEVAALVNAGIYAATDVASQLATNAAEHVDLRTGLGSAAAFGAMFGAAAGAAARSFDLAARNAEEDLREMPLLAAEVGPIEDRSYWRAVLGASALKAFRRQLGVQALYSVALNVPQALSENAITLPNYSS